ncbi:type III restriction-modification system endonuclease [Sodaliphilus sp.]|uniref:type III restriction-modification system endonuclease n=1 Tax=Sodaliphilus sp. TaxID=2815818 RepID=UPI003890DA81
MNVFNGQPARDMAHYRIDLGKRNGQITYEGEDSGFRNADIELSKADLLSNIKDAQVKNLIKTSNALSTGIADLNLDIEMETGTGKTYVYIKTMFELNRRYGWSKFIVVVPSVAIREGVAKSFQMLEEHFMEQYGKKARWFVYNSSNLQQLDAFSQDSGISVMIINTQAFAASLKEGGRSKESKIIYSKRDEFASRRPIDVIAANRPIIIMDEPQRMEGAATQSGLKRFKPLFSLNYSATHKTTHDTVYALDAYDAFKERLVKRIQVRGFEVKNLRGTTDYIYLDNIKLSPKEPPIARIELEVRNAAGAIRRELKSFNVGDSLEKESGLKAYDGYTVSEINPVSGYVSFSNGATIYRGQVIGDKNEEAMQRVQIRETIMAHFEKEKELFARGIKCLSLFFIDEVANYRQYDEDGNEVKGKFQQIFEEEYKRICSENITAFNTPYDQYLQKFSAEDVHKGYFSIDKKGRMVNSKVTRGTDTSDDIPAYDLILKNKERLLSFEEPTRFIFSHSALREGWDNPNVFQICTLRHSNSTTNKRQEVGRGLRICVDKDGIRQDKETLGEDVHNVNVLTVIANESYADFTSALQRETREVLRERVEKATPEYFTGKRVTDVDGMVREITPQEASRIIVYLEDNDYIDADGFLTEAYHKAYADDKLAELPTKLQPIAEDVKKLVRSIFDKKVLDQMVEEAGTTTEENKLNENFNNERFQQLWNEINHQYVYTVHYNSVELVENVIRNLNRNLSVTKLQYVRVIGNQQDATTFGQTQTKTSDLKDVTTSIVKYDLVGDIAKGARLTRKTVVQILQGIGDNIYMFRENPEEFIRNVVKIIKEEKATMIVEHITYNQTEGRYDSSIFVPERKLNIKKVIEAQKHVTPYVAFDSEGEHEFAQALENAQEVQVYAKLPRKLQIPTPVGNYAPDWAIVLTEGSVKHVFFVAETKGSLDGMELRGVEKAKTQCAKKLFNSLSTSKVKYGVVDKFENLYNIINAID